MPSHPHSEIRNPKSTIPPPRRGPIDFGKLDAAGALISYTPALGEADADRLIELGRAAMDSLLAGKTSCPR